MTANTFMEKYFHELRIKTNLNINFIYSQVPTFLNGELYDPRFKNGKVEFGMVSNWKGFFNIELNSSIARSIISGFKYEKRSVSNLERKNYSLKTIYRFGNKMHGAFYFSKQMNQKQKPFYMLDGNIECKISPGCIFSLTLHNIFNHTVFSNTEYSLYEYAERKYILSKRNILLGFQFDF